MISRLNIIHWSCDPVDPDSRYLILRNKNLHSPDIFMLFVIVTFYSPEIGNYPDALQQVNGWINCDIYMCNGLFLNNKGR